MGVDSRASRIHSTLMQHHRFSLNHQKHAHLLTDRAIHRARGVHPRGGVQGVARLHLDLHVGARDAPLQHRGAVGGAQARGAGGGADHARQDAGGAGSGAGGRGLPVAAVPWEVLEVWGCLQHLEGKGLVAWTFCWHRFAGMPAKKPPSPLHARRPAWQRSRRRSRRSRRRLRRPPPRRPRWHPRREEGGRRACGHSLWLCCHPVSWGAGATGPLARRQPLNAPCNPPPPVAGGGLPRQADPRRQADRRAGRRAHALAGKDGCPQISG